MTGSRLIIAGGIFNVLMVIFHSLFWKLFAWPAGLDSLSPDNRGIIQTLNLHLILVFILFSFVSLFKARELLTTTLGRMMTATIGLFYLLRVANEFIFWNMSDFVSQLVVVVCLGIGGLYLVPLYQNRNTHFGPAWQSPKAVINETAWGKADEMRIKKYDTLPDSSIISRELTGSIHYLDSYRTEINNEDNRSIDFLTALLFTSIPKWVRHLLSLRDFLVRPFGLQTGQIPEPTSLDKSLRYKPGDKAIFFRIIERSESEVVMAEDDKHLYFRTSLLAQNIPGSSRRSLFLTTIVQFHNVWGRIYFAPVKPFHKLIMRRMLISFHRVLIENRSTPSES